MRTAAAGYQYLPSRALQLVVQLDSSNFEQVKQTTLLLEVLFITFSTTVYENGDKHAFVEFYTQARKGM